MRVKQFIRNRSKKFWALLVLFIVLVGGIAYIAKTLSDPSQGIVKSASTTQKPITIEASTRVDGKYISFKMPARFHQVESSAKGGTELEKFSYLHPVTISENFEIAVRNLPTGNLNDDSGYKYRTMNPGKYTQETKTINGKTYVVMSSPTEGYSKVAYTTSNGKETTIALTSASSGESESLNQAFDKVLGSFEWL